MRLTARPLLVALVVAAAAAGAAGCASSSPARDYLARPPGTYAVGTAMLTLADPKSGREIPLRVAYPKAPGPHPAVVFSHGALCYAQHYAVITDVWAAHGYVVVLPDHLDSPNNATPPRPDRDLLLNQRIADLAAALDGLEDIVTRAGVPGGIDTNRVAIAGHSFGGMQAMIQAGLPVLGPDGQPVSHRHPRVKAAVVMSGVGPLPGITTEQGYAALTLPLIATGGTLDIGDVGGPVKFPWEWRMSGYDLAPAGDKYRVALEEGDHYLGGLMCLPNRGGAPDPEGARLDAALTLAFLDAYLRNDPAAAKFLQSADIPALSGGRVRYARK
jgi:predicted dienelactone hydrolase